MSPAPAIARLSRVTLSVQVAAAIRDAVLSGAFAPGRQMNEAEIAARFAVSRGPVREALQRLVQEGLLVSRPHRGVFVVELGEDDLADVYLARAAIEGAALRRITAGPERAGIAARLEAAVARMEEAVAKQDWLAVGDADLAFHRSLVEAAESPRLLRMFETVEAETRLCLHLLIAGYRSSAGLAAEHRGLAALATGNDLPGALAELSRHLADPVRYLRRLGAPRTAPDGP